MARQVLDIYLSSTSEDMRDYRNSRAPSKF
jgi:hypothetical protein